MIFRVMLAAVLLVAYTGAVLTIAVRLAARDCRRRNGLTRRKEHRP